MTDSSEGGSSKYSRFRNFLIPDLKNTLQSAVFAHENENFERVEQLLDAAESKLHGCREQLQEDKRAREEGD